MAGAAGLASVAGCVGGGGSGSNESGGNGSSSNGTSGGGGGRSTTVAILAAGSLQNALLNGLKLAVDVPVNIEAHGSATVARLIASGKRNPDIVAVADTALFNQPLSPPWYSVFTSNAVVVAYNKDTKGGRRVANAAKSGQEKWYKPMVNGNVDIGRTDPKTDPLGYRALFMLNLASRYYDDAANLTGKILQQNQIYPETSLVTKLEQGAIGAAIVYRNMAVTRGYRYIDLPNQIDLSTPQYVKEWYNNVTYTLPSGKKIRGDLISYGATTRHTSNTLLNVFDVLTTGTYLKKYGFLLRDQFPNYKGNVPQHVKQAVSKSSGSQSTTTSPASVLNSTVSDITILV